MYRPEKGHVPVLLMKIGDEGIVVRHEEVKGYVESPIFVYYLQIYQSTKLWGLPNGNGWANEPLEIYEGITALEIEAKTIESELYETKKSMKNSGTMIKTAQV